MEKQAPKKQQLKPTVGLASFCLVFIIVTLSAAMAKNDKGWETPPKQIINIPLSAFKTQGGDEFILDTQRNVLGLPDPADHAKGVDLTKYDLEFAFRNADGKHIQLWYKDSKWRNVYSWEFTIKREEPIRFNPFAKGARNVNEFNDFTHIYAIGAKVREGLQGIQIASVRLIRRQ